MSKAELIEALKRFIRAAEAEEELLSNSADIWSAYEAARVLLGDPVKEYPGGYEDMHFHPYGWTEADGCDTCQDYKADHQPAAQPEAEGEHD